MAAGGPPDGSGVGLLYGKDFGAILRRYYIRHTTRFRMNQSIQPVVIFDNPSSVPKPTLPKRFAAGGQNTTTLGGTTNPPAGVYGGMMLQCVVDTLIRSFGTQLNCFWAIDYAGAIAAAWSPGVPTPVAIPHPRAFSIGGPDPSTGQAPLAKNIASLGGSLVAPQSFGGFDAAFMPGTTAGTMPGVQEAGLPGFYVLAGGVFAIMDFGIGSTCPVGWIEWEEHGPEEGGT